MRAAQKKIVLASVSLGVLVLAGPVQAACSFGAPSADGVVVVCRDEFQQTLDYDEDTGRLTLSAPANGRPSFSDAGVDGDDVINVRGNDIVDFDILAVATGGVPQLDLAAGDDVVQISSGSIDGTILGGVGNDSYFVASTDTAGTGLAFDGGAGDDTVRVTGGSVGGFNGGAGTDSLTFTGGDITGAIDAFETIVIKDGPDNDILGSAPLAIDGSGDTSVEILDTRRPDLADPEAGSALALDLSGVSALRAVNSTISFASLEGGLDDLEVRRSVLRLHGVADLTAGRRAGRLSVLNGTVDAANGTPADRLLVSAVIANNATFLIDADEVGGVAAADQLVVITPRGVDPRRANIIRGQNTIVVNFADGFDGSIDGIPVAEARGVDRADVLRALSQFSVVGGANSNPMQGITLAQGDGDRLVLITGDQDNPLTTSVATSTSATASDQAVDDIATDLIEGGGDRVQVSDSFGVFASGQFGHVWHYGYDVTDGSNTGNTPDFEVDQFSLFVTGEADLGEVFGDSEVGFRVAAFGGYVESDVTLDREVADGIRTNFEGSGYNRGGMLGASVSVDRIFGAGHYAYAGTSVAGFLGTTDVVRAETGDTGDYGTQGVVASSKFGVAFAVADTVRLDTRFGIGYTYFNGDDFRDSGGFRFGESRTSYATLSFEPGVQTAVPVGRFIVTPQARLLLDYRPGYVNDASFEGTDFDFDEAQYSVGGELGAGILLTESLTAGAFVSAKGNEDQSSFLAKLAVKYQF